MLRLLLMFIVVTASLIDAQESSDQGGDGAMSSELVGEWDVRWASAIRHNTDGSVEVQKWGDALMVFEQVGDSVTGSWTTMILVRVTWTFQGTFRNGHLRLRSIGHDSDNSELDIIEEIVWDARLTDGRLDGYVALLFRGRARDPARRGLTAVRRGGD